MKITIRKPEKNRKSYSKKESIFIIDPKNKIMEKILKNPCGRTYLDRAILNNAPVSIMVIDRSGTIIAVNKYFLRFTGSTNPVGRLIYQIDFFQREKLVDSYKKIFKTGEPFSRFDCQTVNKKGKTVFLNIIAVPLKNKKGEITGAISMATDNTEAVEAKNNLKKLMDELEEKVQERTRELNQLNQRLSDILDLKSRFAADASHELRTPLMVIQGNIDLSIMEMKQQGQKIPEFYTIILGEIERMRSVLADLAMLTNTNPAQNFFNYQKLNLSEVVYNITRSLEILAAGKNIYLENIKTFPELSLMGDQAKLEKLLSNLLRNAIKYTDPGGKVKVRLKKNKKEAVITIEDNGIGIPEEELSRIFERFYRVDKARIRRENGSGLGLAIAKWIAESHGGSISVSSQMGRGSIFTVRLPLDCQRKTNFLVLNKTENVLKM